MSNSEVHIFWWWCDRGMDCGSDAFVIGEGIPEGWWTVNDKLLKRIGGSLGDRELVFCSEACATTVLGSLVAPSERSGEVAHGISVLLKHEAIAAAVRSGTEALTRGEK